MTPITKRSILAEPTAAQLDLARNLGDRRLDRVPGIVQDDDRTLNNDGTGGFQRQGDGGGGEGFFRHAKNIDGKA